MIDPDNVDFWADERYDPSLPEVRKLFADEAYLTKLHGSMQQFEAWCAGLRNFLMDFGNDMLQRHKEGMPAHLLVQVHTGGERPDAIDFIHIPIAAFLADKKIKPFLPIILRQILLTHRLQRLANGKKIVAFHAYSEAWMVRMKNVEKQTEYILEKPVREDPQMIDIFSIVSHYIHGSGQKQFKIVENKGVRSIGESLLSPSDEVVFPNIPGALALLLQKTCGSKIDPPSYRVLAPL